MKRLFLILGILLAFGLGFMLRGGGGSGAPPSTEVASVWTCSMHPQIQLPQPGACPICGMDLIPLASGPDDDAGPTTLTLTDRAASLAEIETAVVLRGSARKTVRLTGTLEPDGTRTRAIPAHVSGRIEQMHVDFVGQVVRRGAPLFELYSPELYSAQEELLLALKSRDATAGSTVESLRRSAAATVDASRERLAQWGLSPDQIEAIESRGSVRQTVTIPSPINGVVLRKAAVEGMHVMEGQTVYDVADLSRLWLMLDAYESDLPWLGVGSTVSFTTPANPGRTFTGTVSFMEPFLTRSTRSVKVRVEVPNPDGELKPGLFVDAEVMSDLAGDDAEALLIPDTAPLITGERAVVYVADPDVRGRFHGRVVVLGPRTAAGYVVRSGLAQGERVVTRGNFKIDSALQIRAGTSMMNPAATGSLDSVPMEVKQAVDARLVVYYQVTGALSHDNLAEAREAAGRLAGIGPPKTGSPMPPDVRTVWQEADTALRASAAAVQQAATVESARGAFHTLSDRMISMVRQLGAGGSVAVLVYHCPMADQNRGAAWLQPMTGTENPYFGSSMFRCGSETEVIIPVAAAEQPEGGHEHH